MNVTRRLLAVAAAAPVSLMLAAQGKDDEKIQSAQIYCPDDCFVVEVTPSGKVNAGDPLIVLSSPKNDELLNRIQLYSQMIEIYRRQLDDGRRAQQRALQVSILAEYNKELVIEKTIYENAVNEAKTIGVGGTYDVLAPKEIPYLEAQDKRDTQALTVSNFDKETKDITDRLNAVATQISVQTKFLQSFKDNLTIKAPYQGSFKSHCVKGLFYKKGQSLGTI